MCKLQLQDFINCVLQKKLHNCYSHNITYHLFILFVLRHAIVISDLLFKYMNLWIEIYINCWDVFNIFISTSTKYFNYFFPEIACSRKSIPAKRYVALINPNHECLKLKLALWEILLTCNLKKTAWWSIFFKFYKKSSFNTALNIMA